MDLCFSLASLLALAATGPDLTGNERFGISANYGNFQGASAFGMGVEGVLGYGRNSTPTDRFCFISGFWGVCFAQGRSGDDVFGRPRWRAVDMNRPVPYVMK